MSVLNSDGDPDSPIAKLDQIICLTSLHGTPEAQALATWLYRAACVHLEKGGRFDHALGLCGTKSRTPRYRVLLATRNDCLRTALQLLGGDYSALAREIDQYLRRVPSLLRERRKPQISWNVVRCAIHEAAYTQIKLPQTVKGLKGALGNE